ncbi:Transposon Tf2-6 polyprotein, partial [Clarias magur]
KALLDSGSAGNFISRTLCRQLKVPLELRSVPIQICCVTGAPPAGGLVRYITPPLRMQVGWLHEEKIRFLVLEKSTSDVILGRPWLTLHDPILSWQEGEILKWGDDCFSHCLSQVPALPLNSTSVESLTGVPHHDIPEAYSSFQDIFCPVRATQLPPHRPWDCAIDLLPGAPVPR